MGQHDIRDVISKDIIFYPVKIALLLH